MLLVGDDGRKRRLVFVMDITERRKLEQAGLGEGGGIETVRQQGYRFSLDNLPDKPSAVEGSPQDEVPAQALEPGGEQLSDKHQTA